MTPITFRQRLAGWLLHLPAPLRWWKAATAPQTLLAAMRRDYRLASLEARDLTPDPIDQFGRWLEGAIAARLVEPHSMVLGTADAAGRVSTRNVLLKGYDRRGFVFYTNYESRKARDLEANPRASLLFSWLPLERQVELTGSVEKISRKETESYFASRPLSSRIGAWASPQSQVLRDAAELEARVNEAVARFRHEPIVAPPFWGGYRLMPQTFEFWQGRPSRLHDRFRYTREPDGPWKIERLAP